MRRFLILAALTLPAASVLASPERDSVLAECSGLEEQCETVCLNRPAETSDDEISACYVTCGDKGNACRDAAPGA